MSYKLIILILLFLYGCFGLARCVNYEDEFNEELLLKPLYSNKLYAYFQFSTTWHKEPNNKTFENCHLFPRALGEILGRYDVHELHISLTAGLWRYEQWGYPVVDSAPGVELWAWFKNDAVDIDKQWKDLANSLSGLFCASLNFIDAANTFSPEYSLRPLGVVEGQVNSTRLRYASLPREVVCTENLTPWKKLLPCDSHKGLASLLNSGYIHSNRYHSLSIGFRQICRNKDCRQTSMELKQTVSLVYDYLILLNRNWSLRKLFGQGLFEACPLAASSNIYVDVSSNNSVPFVLSPHPDEMIELQRGGDERLLARYNLKSLTRVLNVAVSHTGRESVGAPPPPPLHANQYLSSYGQESGHLVHQIYNNYWDTLDIILLIQVPWYVPVYVHTLHVKRANDNDVPYSVRYSAGVARTRPHLIELALRVGARTVARVSLEVQYVFLRWQEYPPDANHGFYVGSSILTARLPTARNYTAPPIDGTLFASSLGRGNTSVLVGAAGYPVRIRTHTLIVTLPTPDFSMPYNVICLACTVVALAFGPLHNITTKKMVYRCPSRRSNFLQKIKNWLVSLGNKDVGNKKNN